MTASDDEWDWRFTDRAEREYTTLQPHEQERIVSKLGGEVTDTMLSQIGTASSFASDSFRIDVRHQLTKWKSKLTRKQVAGIMEVVEAFQLDFYKEDPVPDRGRLLQFQESTAPHFSK